MCKLDFTYLSKTYVDSRTPDSLLKVDGYNLQSWAKYFRQILTFV